VFFAACKGFAVQQPAKVLPLSLEADAMIVPVVGVVILGVISA